MERRAPVRCRSKPRSTLIGAPYDLVGDDVMRPVGCNPAAIAVNPLHQVPVLTLPTGEVMTESAAILIYLADSYPHARLAPAGAIRGVQPSCGG